MSQNQRKYYEMDTIGSILFIVGILIGGAFGKLIGYETSGWEIGIALGLLGVWILFNFVFTEDRHPAIQRNVFVPILSAVLILDACSPFFWFQDVESSLSQQKGLIVGSILLIGCLFFIAKAWRNAKSLEIEEFEADA